MHARAELRRHHHITLNVGDAQSDYDFHTQVLGLRSVKKTMLYDGSVPIYHLYYGNDVGQESTLVTTFPRRHGGRPGRVGRGQITALNLTVPEQSLHWWGSRLADAGFEVTPGERFGERFLGFVHPAGVPYRLVGVEGDDREPAVSDEVPPDAAIRGVHGIDVSVADGHAMAEFMTELWDSRPNGIDGAVHRFEMGSGGAGCIVDVVVAPDLEPGSDGDGVVNHCAFQSDDFAAQQMVKSRLEKAGCANVTKVFDRGYFDSVYVDLPEGAVFEAAVSKPLGFATDEAITELGHSLMVAPQLEGERESLVAKLDPLDWPGKGQSHNDGT